MLVFLFSAAQIFLALKYLHYYQMSGYRFEWNKSLLEKFFMSDILCLIFVLDVFVPELHVMLAVVLCLYLMTVSLLTMGNKTPLKFTKRMIRNLISAAVVIFAFNFIVFWKFPSYLFASGLVTGPLVWLSSLIVLPIETLIRRRYVEVAKEKLKRFPNCRVIGITGSYGKTTTKNLLFDLLKNTFRTARTPASYNTEMGVAMTILKQVDANTEFLICEMGARRKGDIEKLCQVAPPDYSILTSIGFCHYKTFKTVENIMDTKFELPANTQKLCIFGDGERTNELYMRASCDKILTGSSLWEWRSIGIDSFTLKLEGTEYFFRTNLVGTIHQKNLCAALILAYKLGVPVEELRERCLSLEQTPHRLQIVKNGSVTIIDDSYNSNISGIKGMIEVVKSFSGRKILVTCGMVELGRLQYGQNVEFAKLCGAFDFLFIVSKTNRKAFEQGLAEIKFDPARTVYFKKLSELEEFLKTFMRGNDVIVFENDLPDNYL